MTIPQIILIILLGSATLLYATQWIPPEATSLIAIATLVFAGLLPAGDALAGFSSSATLTVAAMFVLSAGLVRTGALEAVTIHLARFSQGSSRRLLLILGIAVPIASAFINNTPVVVMLIPVVISLSRQFDDRPSKFLIPISYFAILGGTMTLIGTSTNILIDDIYRQIGGSGFGLFDFMPMGIIFMVIGLIYVVLFSNRLLPNRAPLVDLVDDGSRAAYMTEVVVGDQSTLVGKRTQEVFGQAASPQVVRTSALHRRHRRLGNPAKALDRKRIQNPSNGSEEAVNLLQLVRDGYNYRAEELHEIHIARGDTLLVYGAPKEIALFLESSKVDLATILQDNERVPIQNRENDLGHSVVEAVVLPDSNFQGRFVGDLALHEHHSVQVLGIQRRGRQQLSGLRTMRLMNGDVLLLRGVRSHLQDVAREGKLLLVEGVGRSILRSTKNRQALLIMAGVVLLASLTNIPIVIWALAGSALMVITQCLSLEDAMHSLDANTLLLLAASIPLGIAMQTTGLAQRSVELLLSTIGTASPIVFLSAFYLLANLTTQVVSTSAVAVVFVPVALNLAISTGLNPTPLIMAIAFGSNASLITPIGHPVNTIVMGPGGYRFGDYLRIGLPLMIILWIAATIAIPLIWPLT